MNSLSKATSKAENVHVVLGGKNNPFPLNVTFHLPDICLLLVVESCCDTKDKSLFPKSSDSVTRAAEEPANSLMMSLSHRCRFFCWMMLHSSSRRVCGLVKGFTHQENDILKLKGLLNEG